MAILQTQGSSLSIEDIFTAIPLVEDIVFSYLNPHDLLQAVQVSKLWSRRVASHISRRYYFSCSFSNKIDYEPHLKNGFTRLCHYMHSMEVSSIRKLKFELRSHLESDVLCEESQSELLNFYNHSPVTLQLKRSVTDLRLDGLPCFSILEQCLQRFSNLRNLSVFVHVNKINHSHIFKNLALNQNDEMEENAHQTVFPCLKSLTISPHPTLSRHTKQDLMSRIVPPQLLTSFPNLEKLNVTECLKFPSPGTSFLEKILVTMESSETFSNIKEFGYNGTFIGSNFVALIKKLPQTVTKLQLSLNVSTTQDFEHLQHFLEAVSSNVEILDLTLRPSPVLKKPDERRLIFSVMPKLQYLNITLIGSFITIKLVGGGPELLFPSLTQILLTTRDWATESNPDMFSNLIPNYMNGPGSVLPKMPRVRDFQIRNFKIAKKKTQLRFEELFLRATLAFDNVTSPFFRCIRNKDFSSTVYKEFFKNAYRE